MTTAKRLEELKQRLLKQSRGLLIAEGVALGLALVLIMIAVAGCPGTKSDGDAGEIKARNDDRREAEVLFANAVNSMGSLEEAANDRETLQRIVNHLDQWIEYQDPDEDWTSDAEVAELAKAYAEGEENFNSISEALDAIRSTQSPVDVVSRSEDLSDLIPAAVESLDTIVSFTNSNFLATSSVMLQSTGEEINASLALPNSVSVEERAMRLVRGESFNQLLLSEEWSYRMASTFDRLSRTHDIASLNFPPGSEQHIQTSLWLRGIADWRPRGAETELEKVELLFDWTVRNIDLIGAFAQDPQSGDIYPRPLQTLRETLILGRGTRADRAWLFISLLRRIGIDAAVLVMPDPEGTLGERSVFAVGVLLEDEVYLFEPGLGLPFIAPGGIALTEQGLDIQPATLAQAISDPSVCEAFDVGEDEIGVYPVRSTDIPNASFGVVLDPLEISHRMRILESNMSGEDRLVLTASASSLRERFVAIEGVQGCNAWSRPLRTACERTFFPDDMAPDLALFELAWIQDPSMWEARNIQLEEDGRFYGNANELDDYRRRLENPLVVPRGPDSYASESPLRKGRIYYFLGKMSGEQSAASYLQEARPPDRQLESSGAPEQQRMVFRLIKLAASYSLGQVAYSRGNMDMAVDCFLKRTIMVPLRPNAYFSGAAYNLARAYEMQGEYDEAIRWYANNPEGDARFAGLLRIQLLNEQLPPEEEPEETEEPDDTAESTEVDASEVVEELEAEASETPSVE